MKKVKDEIAFMVFGPQKVHALRQDRHSQRIKYGYGVFPGTIWNLVRCECLVLFRCSLNLGLKGTRATYSTEDRRLVMQIMH